MSTCLVGRASSWLSSSPCACPWPASVSRRLRLPSSMGLLLWTLGPTRRPRTPICIGLRVGSSWLWRSSLMACWASWADVSPMLKAKLPSLAAKAVEILDQGVLSNACLDGEVAAASFLECEGLLVPLFSRAHLVPTSDGGHHCPCVVAFPGCTAVLLPLPLFLVVGSWV